MKRLVFMLILLDCSALFRLATGQENRAELKHLFVPSANRNIGASVSALNIERGVDYPSVVRLKGRVEINMPVCVRTGSDNALVCNGHVIVRADTAEMHEDTGAIEAHGDVTVTPTRF